MLASALFMVVAVSVWRQAMADELPTNLLLASSIHLGIVAYGGAILVTARPLVRQVLGIQLLVRRPSDGAHGAGSLFSLEIGHASCREKLGRYTESESVVVIITKNI